VSFLLRDAYLEYKEAFPPQSWESYQENIMDVRSRLNESELIVAEVKGQLAGAVTLYLDTSHLIPEVWPPGWAGIRLLGVHLQFRGRGIGRSLIEECIRRCRKRKIKTIGLHTAAIMKVARRLYECMGFVRAPEHDFHPAADVVIMAYRLPL
jgi:GNAT superfamily N-acetyltransferase